MIVKFQFVMEFLQTILLFALLKVVAFETTLVHVFHVQLEINASTISAKLTQFRLLLEFKLDMKEIHTTCPLHLVTLFQLIYNNLMFLAMYHLVLQYPFLQSLEIHTHA